MRESDRPPSSPFIRALSGRETAERVPSLAEILIDCVEGGASVSFMTPLSRERAETFWYGVATGVAAGDRILLIAEEDGDPVGTVQVVFAPQENQPHRADVAKMLVHRRARRRGLGAALLRAAEDAALAAGRTLLVLDTVTDADGDRLYARGGWTRVGSVPGFALWPDGRPCATTYFYKRLGTPDRSG